MEFTTNDYWVQVLGSSLGHVQKDVFIFGPFLPHPTVLANYKSNLGILPNSLA